jgi:fructose-1-phosphate kinase PfkB-like protein
MRASVTPTDVESTLGGSDAFLAGFLHASLADRSLEERASLGIATVAANMRSLGAGVFDKGDAVRLQREVSVEQLATPTRSV